ncbi:hypothetical protein CERZMDRAFT_89990 [Cercospora zeae-maydis SCOH1-5]|uniref:Uncharacterized protein n=1 Tax=Cercospora zeae-maydis SCOH1-5 TaxID=717836 RepID=A0A6A6FQP1_9PEZI|nr:hypothetical protein CERZMDRAFT_89990 [Cercospora zeae-maydis SCOH1-5]
MPHANQLVSLPNTCTVSLSKLLCMLFAVVHPLRSSLRQADALGSSPISSVIPGL